MEEAMNGTSDGSIDRHEQQEQLRQDGGIINYNLYNKMKILINYNILLHVTSDVSGNERLMVG
jgi:hypothetical protein